MNETGQSNFNQARIEWAIRLRYSPMPVLTMEYLTTQLNAFRIGELRLVGKIWEIMLERDGELAVNADKRASDLAGLEYQIVSDGSADGDKHAQALTYFYKHLRATHALDQDKVGGVSQLLYDMGSAHSHYYSAHEILLRPDNPAGSEVTAEFRHTPIWFFETRRGYLGYLAHIFDMYGTPCLEGEWLTCVGSGWMRPLSIAFAYKNFSLRDWLQWSARYGSGFLEGITDGQKGDAAWEETNEALRCLMSDGAVLHNRQVEFKFLEQSARNQQPFEPIVETVNRLYAKCYRGVDLATGSRSGASGGGGAGAGQQNPVGASIQSEESGIFLVRDAAWASGYLNERVDVPIIRYLFSQKPRAYIAIMPPQDDDSASDLASVNALVPMGLKISMKEAYKRFRWSAPCEGEACLVAPIQPAAPGDEDETPPDPTPPVAAAATPEPSVAAPAEDATQPATEEKSIAAGADPAAVVQTASRQMPDPQVQGGSFWSTVGAATRAILRPCIKPSAKSTNPGPAFGYALPNESVSVAPLNPAFESAALAKFAAALHEDLGHAAAQVQALLQIDDPEHFKTKAKQLAEKWEQITGNTLVAPSSADALAPVLGTAFLQGATSKHQILANWDPDQPRVSAGSSGGGQFAAARDKVIAVRDGRLDESAYAKVSPQTAEKIKSATGLDATGHSHFIDHGALVHINRQHGVGNEDQPGHQPVTKDDIEKIPEIVANPDSIKDGGKSSLGLPTHVYAKRYNGTTYYVEEHWSGEKVLAAKTMWKTSAPVNSATPLGGFSHTSKTSGAQGT